MLPPPPRPNLCHHIPSFAIGSPSGSGSRGRQPGAVLGAGCSSVGAGLSSPLEQKSNVRLELPPCTLKAVPRPGCKLFGQLGQLRGTTKGKGAMKTHPYLHPSFLLVRGFHPCTLYRGVPDGARAFSADSRDVCSGQAGKVAREEELIKATVGSSRWWPIAGRSPQAALAAETNPRAGLEADLPVWRSRLPVLLSTPQRQRGEAGGNAERSGGQRLRTRRRAPRFRSALCGCG